MPSSPFPRFPLRVMAAVMLAVLGGCSMVPIYKQPGMTLPTQWSSHPGNAQPSTIQADPPEWWKSFGSAELDALVARGLADGFDLKIAIHRLEQAQARAGIASAAQYPTLGLAINGSRGTSSSSTKRSATLQASYALDLWGLNRALASSARATAESSGFDMEIAKVTLVSSIASTYFQALSLNERVRLAQLLAKDAQAMLSLVQTQARLGAASDLEVAQQRNALQTFQAAVPILMQQRDQVTGDLAVLIGDLPENLHLVAENLRDVRIPDVAGTAPADAIARLPEVRSAEARLKAADFDIGAARAAFLPSLSLAGGYGTLLNPSAALWTVAGSVLQPLFDAGQREGQLRVDRAHAEELVVTYKKAIATALQTVESQMSATSATRDAEQLDEAALQSARQALDLARIRMTNGATDFLTVLLSERTLYQAEDTALQIRLQRLQSTVGLYRALGTGQSLPDESATATVPSSHPWVATIAKETS
ncbi:MAG: ttgC [Variovorax sp.]|nr:ttgC [Variovorax sp.]